MARKMKHIIVENMEECLICGNPNVEIHHVFFGIKQRSLSTKYGLVIPLCAFHHRDMVHGIHFDSSFCKQMQRAAQESFEAKEGTREDFIRIFGKNYIL